MSWVLNGNTIYSEREAVAQALKAAYSCGFNEEVGVFLAVLQDYGYRLTRIEVE